MAEIATDTRDFEQPYNLEYAEQTRSTFEDHLILQEMRRIGASKVYKQQMQTMQPERKALYST